MQIIQRSLESSPRSDGRGVCPVPLDLGWNQVLCTKAESNTEFKTCFEVICSFRPLAGLHAEIEWKTSMTQSGVTLSSKTSTIPQKQRLCYCLLDENLRYQFIRTLNQQSQGLAGTKSEPCMKCR